MKTGILSVDIILDMNIPMMILSWLARGLMIYLVMIFLPVSLGKITQALLIAGIIQMYMVGSVLIHRGWNPL
jgi:hypothetical protein